ncbi:Putative 1,2-phenylacetyl-CoA epoxidase, subunit D [Candidatus Thermoflexus japonica]|uniref:1,2-phenylacetyl-CoA epoxidase, subunit D n=1 Tax=Candidatus Thermoflexus japonica TaxID=2035417 RepID=A0A2H5Y818_9CHLR|nr:Putative 1,2-phenylacetyl-CoA epoxidase, subunit D [Candidatus Thermoflexus japonica]
MVSDGAALTREAVLTALEAVKDPEIPTVSVVDLGLIYEVRVNGDEVEVDFAPTFVGCPALHVMEREIVERIQALGARRVQVRRVYRPPWTADRMNERARQALRELGIAPPRPVPAEITLAVFERLPCPFCGSTDTRMENLFGPTSCRALFYCNACQQPFEAFKPL